MIDHITIGARDLEASHVFYEGVLATLGIQHNIGGPEEGFYGYGPAENPEFEISGGRVFVGALEGDKHAAPVHVAFRAQRREQVQAFYEQALRLGGKDNGAPGLREHYSPTYYAAFVLDPDGNNIEVVTFSDV